MEWARRVEAAKAEAPVWTKGQNPGEWTEW